MKGYRFVALCACLLAHATAAERTVDSSVEGTIKRVLKTGIITGWDTKWLTVSGDSGAIALTRILADKPLSDGDIGGALAILDSCFYDMARVANRADREPGTTLLLLRYFDSQTQSPAVQARIAETRKRIQERFDALPKS